MIKFVSGESLFGGRGGGGYAVAIKVSITSCG